MRQASPARAMWLLARLRLQRLGNIFSLFRFGRGKNAKSRQATPGKRRAGWLLAGLVGLAMLVSVISMSHNAVVNMQCYLAPASACLDRSEARKGPHVDTSVAVQELGRQPFDAAVATGITMQLSLLVLLSVLLPLSTREMAQADWDLEWLVTLPARRSTLLWGRVLERTLVNPTGWLFLAPSIGIIAWFSGYRWSAPLIGLAGALALLPLAAMARTVADTGMRMWLPPSQLRNLQALATVTSMPLMYLAIGFASMSEHSPLLALVRLFPAWASWSAPGLMIALINGRSGWLGLLLLLAQLSVPLWLGMQLLRYQLRGGVAASGARESARRDVAPAPASALLARLLPSSPVKRRELRLLARDRNFLIQSLLLPLLIFGSQLLFAGSPDTVKTILDSPRFLAATAFGIGSYMLMLSAFQTLNSEGQSLWILFTVPHSIESVLKEKAEFWAVLALLYPLLILGAGWLFAPHTAPALLSVAVVVIAGIPIFSVIAVSLGVFGCDPLSQEARTRVRPSYVYLYMMLSGVYVYAVTGEDWSQKLVLIVLMAAFASALWQKARDQLPYLLDPSMSPPARVSTSDGLIAAMLFFVLQAAVMIGLIKLARVRADEAMVIAFSLAGAVVYCSMRLTYLLCKTRDVPALLRGGVGPALAWGVGGGLLAAACGLGYLYGLHELGLHDDPRRRIALPAGWLFALAVLAAPLCEEFIFRGLIFGGLRRSTGLLPSILMSAALFAIIHPPLSMVPVFVLGAVCALAYERSRSLAAPMLVHAIYNGAVLAFQLGS